MGTWTEEFRNVRAAGAGDVVRLLRDRVAAYASSAPPLGEILYFPPGDTILRLGTAERLVLPEPIEVRIAPGGRIVVIGAFSVLEIQGKLTAPIGPIFATLQTPPSDPEAAPLGGILLTNRLLECVHPEWWGAGRLAGRKPAEVAVDEREQIAGIDTEAIERAIEIAMLNNTTPSTMSGMPAVSCTVVELLGTYLLSRPVRIGHEAFFREPTSATAALREAYDRSSVVEIRGRLGDPGQVALSTTDKFEGDALLDVRFVACLRLHGVGIEAPRDEVSCVRLLGLAHEAAVLNRKPHEIRHCRFRSRGIPSTIPVEGSMVQIGLVSMAAATSKNALSSGSGALRLEFEGCVFETIGPAGASVGYAVRLRSEGALSSVGFRGCTFAGEARAMIDASGFDVGTTSCRFENRMIPQKLASGDRASVLELHTFWPEGGVDIFLRRAASERERRQIYEALAMVFGSLVTLGAANGTVFAFPPIEPRALPNGSLTAQDCRSTSPQFLVTAVPRPDDESMRDATIIGLHHQFDHTRAGVPNSSKPPAIHWRASAAPTRASLFLIGCRFDGLVRDGHPRIVAAQGDDRPAVFNYGIVSGDGPVVVTDLIATPGVISSLTIVGVVPQSHL